MEVYHQYFLFNPNTEDDPKVFFIINERALQGEIILTQPKNENSYNLSTPPPLTTKTPQPRNAIISHCCFAVGILSTT